MAEKKKKRIPLGKPLKLTDAELDEMAKVTPADIAKAAALWRNTVPPEFKSLLDAKAEEDLPSEGRTA